MCAHCRVCAYVCVCVPVVRAQVRVAWTHVLRPPLVALARGGVHVWRHPELWLAASLALLGALYALHATGVIGTAAGAAGAALLALQRALLVRVVAVLACAAGSSAPELSSGRAARSTQHAARR